MKTMLYWSILEHEATEYIVLATDQGLCYIGSPHADMLEAISWADKHLPNYELTRQDEQLAPYIEQLKLYLAGHSQQFSLSCHLIGTPFQRSVWQELEQIPFGTTTSYGVIASKLGKPSAARAVGAAIGKNPVLMVIPCHRVIGASGALTGFRGGLEMKRELLKLEGIL